MTSVSDHTDNLLEWAGNFRVAIGEEYSKHISLIAAESLFHEGMPYSYEDNGYALYGGRAASFNTSHSVTNMELTEITDLQWDPEYGDYENLTDSGLVIFFERSGRFFIRRDVTLHENEESAFKYLSNFLVIQALIRNIRKGLSPYVGSVFPADSVVKTIIENGIAATKGHKSVTYNAECNRHEGYIRLTLNVNLVGYINTITVQVYLRIF